jgi:glutathione S-transferase
MKIYGPIQSRANRCLWALEEASLDYEHISLDMAAGESQSEQYLALNPSGKVPTLVDGDFVLTESMAINRYVAGKVPGPLLPSDARARGKIDQWTYWAVTEVEPFVTLVFREMKLGDSADQGLIAKCKDYSRRALQTIELCLGDSGDYLLGDSFCLADLNVASVIYFLPLIGTDLEPTPNTAAWLQRCQARPAWLKVLGLDSAA